MKNYALNKEEEKKFILNYKIEDSLSGNKRMVIYLANGDKYKIPYNIDNEKRVLELMKDQVIKARKVYDFIKQKYFNNVFWVMTNGLLTLTCLLILLFGYNLVVSSFLLIFFASITSICLGKVNKYKKLNEDIRKNNLFIDSNNLFCNKSMNENVFSRVSERSKTSIESKNKITLNDMDNISYNDMMILIDNIKRDNEFGFNYEPKKLIKK